TQRIRQLRLQELSTYGLMKGSSQKNVSGLIDYLTAAGFLKATAGQYPVLQLTQAGADVLRGKTKVARKQAVKAQRSLPENDGLFEQLRALRMTLATEQGVPPFVIFSDKALHEMSAQRPETDSEFLAVKGVGQNKLQKYG